MALFSEWRWQRVGFSFLLSFVVCFISRLFFLRVQPIPCCLDFNPFFALMLLAALFYGGAGLCGAVLANALADKVAGFWGGMILFRAAGIFFAGLCVRLFWGGGRFGCERARAFATDFDTILHCWLSLLPASLLFIGWQAIGSEVLKLYAFSYMAWTSSLSCLIFLPVIGLPFYVWLANWAVYPAEVAVVFSFRDALLYWLVVLAAIVLGVIVSSVVYSQPPWPPLVLGCAGFAGVEFFCLPLLSFASGLVFIASLRRR